MHFISLELVPWYSFTARQPLSPNARVVVVVVCNKTVNPNLGSGDASSNRFIAVLQLDLHFSPRKTWFLCLFFFHHDNERRVENGASGVA